MSEIEDDFEPICEMKFVETQTKKTIIVRLGPPIFDEEKALYYCISELEGLELERLENGNLKGLEEGQRRRTYGESVFHAPELALVRFSTLVLQGSMETSRVKMEPPPASSFLKEFPGFTAPMFTIAFARRWTTKCKK
jgi:hypothetical protein